MQAHIFNARMQRLGWRPAPVGQSAWKDRARFAVRKIWVSARRLLIENDAMFRDWGRLRIDSAHEQLRMQHPSTSLPYTQGERYFTPFSGRIHGGRSSFLRLMVPLSPWTGSEVHGTPV